MSYIYSRALVEAFSAANCSDIDAFAPSSENHTHNPSWWHDKTMEPSRHSRFGMTYAPLTESLGAELLMWFAADSLAKISVLPETGPASTANDLDYGQKWRGSLAKYDPVTRSLKTAQLSFLEDLTGCSPTLPRSGWMLDGACFPLPMLALSTSGNASGFWQTPVADDSANRAAGKWNSRGEPKLSAQVMFPTPLANSHTGAGHGPNKTGAPNLQTFVANWPTPTVCGNYNRKGLSATSGDGLATAVAMSSTMNCSVGTDARTAKAKTYPTATATAYKGWSPNHNRASTDDRLDYTVERESFQPGQQTPPMRLNPDWVEWLMGWPIGHTALKPSETGRLAEWRQQHSPCFQDWSKEA